MLKGDFMDPLMNERIWNAVITAAAFLGVMFIIWLEEKRNGRC